MRSQRLGTSTSEVEVLSVTPKGIWLYVKDREYVLSLEHFPWFQKASISQIQHVELCHGRYLRWKDLDVDLELQSLEYPDRYPLRYI